MQGAGCRVQGAGCKVQGAGCRVQGAGYRVQGAGCRVQGAGCRVQGAGCKVQGRPVGLAHGGPLGAFDAVLVLACVALEVRSACVIQGSGLREWGLG